MANSAAIPAVVEVAVTSRVAKIRAARKAGETVGSGLNTSFHMAKAFSGGVITTASAPLTPTEQEQVATA